MSDRSSRLWRRRLVNHLRRQGLVHEPRVEDAFLDVPREVFVPETFAGEGLVAVYRDDAIVTRRDPETKAALSSSSQPAIMAIMLEMLDLHPGHRVLEIGAGTGYNAAIVERLVGPRGLVASIDIDVDTVARAAAALRSIGSRVGLVVADGVPGLPGLRGSGKPADRMVVTASTAVIPCSWHQQLVDGGRLVVPVRLSDEVERAHAVTAFEKVAAGFDSVTVTSGGFMPLRSYDGSMFGPAGPASSLTATPTPVDGGGESPFAQVTREEMDCLVITVRYDQEPPKTRWRLDRGDHWIGVDTAES
ncbi:MAG: protein-L-isoaspartate O-methyltransferase family protein [Acidimicrobiales bacterium]